MIIHRKLSKMKNKILPTCLKGNYGQSLGEFSNMSYGVVRAERVKNGLLSISCYANLCNEIVHIK